MTKTPFRKLLVHCALITAAGFSLYTLFADRLPHPEDISPFVYAIALLVCLLAWLKLPKGRKWLYGPIVLLCLLALLDESGYGSEVFDIQPFYSTRYNTEVRDLHNAFGLGQELLSLWLAEKNWQAAEFMKFLFLDGALILGGFLFAWGLQLSKETERQDRIVRWTPTGWLLLGLAAAGWLLALPADERTAVWGGYSIARLSTIAGILLASALPLCLARRTGWQPLKAKLAAWLTGRRGQQVALWAAALVLAGLAYQVQATFVFLPDAQVRLARVTPVAMWLLAAAGLAWLSIMAWRGHFRRSLGAWLRDALNWLESEPAYFYAGFALALILVAQLIDREVIPLNQWIPPAEHIPLWGLWTEEVFEMLGAVFFFLAGRHFKTINDSSKEPA
ncbi:MAG: hypothetical protein KIT46_01700 [Anaerolineales bacterium]|nr:hypothetical protein [Anaerolineales bacterium]MCW5854738.1 hypothetical protein [Anaerolineales bacterium]